MKRFYLQDLDIGRTYRITAPDLLSAIRRLDGFGDAAHTEVAAPGAATLRVYRRAPTSTNADWSYLGTVREFPPIAFID